MPLTPADVHNVVFKKPPIGKRGYDEDDVDAFELRRDIGDRTGIDATFERTPEGHAEADSDRTVAGGDDLLRSRSLLERPDRIDAPT